MLVLYHDFNWEDGVIWPIFILNSDNGKCYLFQALVDTGAKDIFITEKVINELKLTCVDTTMVRGGLTDKLNPVYIVSVILKCKKLHVGEIYDAILTDQKAIKMKEDPEGKFDVIIGRSILRLGKLTLTTEENGRVVSIFELFEEPCITMDS